MPTAAPVEKHELTSVGLYTVSMAATLLHERSSRVRAWVEGQPNSEAEPIIHAQLPRIGPSTVLSFLDLIEARFVKHFCDLGLSPQSIRKVANKLRERHKTDHPFATNRRFRTDGKMVFMEVAETESEHRILNLMNDNFEMGEVIEKSLFEMILYADDLAYRWHPMRETPKVIIDPKFAFGRPVIEVVGVPTDVLYDAFMTGGGYEDAAEEFEVSEDDVRQAVQFERALVERVFH
jgi:uncharacterized protein (DUF433 family)